MTGVLVKEERTQRHREEGHAKTEEDWSYAATKQGTLGATRSLKRQGRSLSWSLEREDGLTKILILDFQPPNRNNKFLLFEVTQYIEFCFGHARN